MPAEWEQHQATWISWPHEESDWPGKFEPVKWVYAEIVRALAPSEQVEILCDSDAVEAEARFCTSQFRIRPDRIRFHKVRSNRSWLRDSMPIGVVPAAGGLSWVQWRFNAWAKYDNFELDGEVPAAAARISGIPLVQALRPDNGEPMVLEGGAIDVDGAGTMLTTEECLLSAVQERNPGLSRGGYEEAFSRYLGIKKTIWLGRSCEGDDTHGHVDDAARFVKPGVVVVAVEADPSDPNYEIGADNLQRLSHAVDAAGRKVEAVKLPMPGPVFFAGQRLPASYANFYIGNSVVLVPTFNDPNDTVALTIIRGLFPGRSVVGIACTDLVLGLGTLHCLTQQQPSGS